METVMNILVIAFMWGSFTLFKRRSDMNKKEFYIYLAAMIFVVVLVGFYYSFYQLLWGGLAIGTGAAFGIGWNRHIEEN